MNVRELIEILKDLPDDMKVKVFDGYWSAYLPALEVKVGEDEDGEFLGIM